MARTKSTQSFVCRECGGVQSRWAGKCPDCGAWDAMESFNPDAGGSAGGTAPSWTVGDAAPMAATPIGAVQPLDVPRLEIGISELDRTLGGGLVPGSVIMLGGDPGIGKSTLLLQAVVSLAQRGVRALYASSEESAQQVKLRAERISDGRSPDELYLLAESSVARIIQEALRVKARVLVVDSIQLVHRHDLDALPGSVSQLRRCCLELVQAAKSTGIVVALVGHVTKEGDLAGPKLLEHLVDVVLSFEGDRHHAYRLVRSIKNRFGSTHELGLFEMTGAGLEPVDEGALAAVHASAPRPGASVAPVLAGSRVLLAEVQALTATGFLGSAKRKASGIDAARLAMMIAVLETHGGLRLADQDVYASVTGGLRVIEPASDLAVAMAVAGAFLGRAVRAGTALSAEVGLGGELRPVRSLEQRVSEALRRGCTAVAVPAAQADAVARSGAECIPLRSIAQALELLEPAAARRA